jgi:dTDP-glucose 4,6-dehydratase
MKVMVTGCAGFIGSNFVCRLFNFYGNEIRVLSIDNLSCGSNIANSKHLENKENHTFLNANITDSDRIYDLINDFDAIVNFAADTHIDRSISNPSSFFRNDAYGIFMLLDAVRRSEGTNKYV